MAPMTDVRNSAINSITASSEISKELTDALLDYCRYEFRKEALDDVVRRVADFKNCKSGLLEDFGSRLAFGTAGLRAKMAISGTNVMNVLTVLQTSQGIAAYLKTRAGSQGREIFVGYDGRYNSRDFAKYTAAAFAVNGFKVHLFDKVSATPFTPYAIKKYNGLFGVQITASHNPKMDNGYKVYDSNGAQIIPPVDKDIAYTILNNLAPREEVLECFSPDGELKPNPNIVTDSFDRIKTDYMSDMQKAVLKDTCTPSDVKIVYTAMHGVGSAAVRTFMQAAKFNIDNLIVVPEQDLPDPEFPTVSFPNPEEEGAMDLAQKLADSKSASLVFANDPDADRFALCEKMSDGTWRRFTGNEIGVMIGNMCMENAKSAGLPYDKQLFVSTAVSSQLLKKMVEKNGCTYLETLTGFKWIMNTAIDVCKDKGLTFVMGYEEALGYAPSMLVPDKDGVTTSGVFAQKACELYSKGLTFYSFLNSIYDTNGFFVSNNGYVKCYEQNQTTLMFQELRNNQNYMTHMNNVKITRIRDVTTAYDSAQPDKKCILPKISSEMITFYLEDESVITLRTSGTEPKIKWYSEKCTQDTSPSKIKQCEHDLQDLIQWVTNNVFQPGKYPVHL